MGILGNKGVDIDFTLLQKKGFIKKQPEKEAPFKVNAQGMIDLTQPQQQMMPKETLPMIQQNNESSPFNFLDNLAQSATQTTSNPFLEVSATDDGKDLNAVKNKVEDLEFKLERLMEKLSLIESKLDGFERKVFS